MIRLVILRIAGNNLGEISDIGWRGMVVTANHVDVVRDGAERAEGPVDFNDARGVVGGIGRVVRTGPGGTDEVGPARPAVDRVAPNRVRDEKGGMSVLPTAGNFEVSVGKGMTGPVGALVRNGLKAPLAPDVGRSGVRVNGPNERIRPVNPAESPLRNQFDRSRREGDFRRSAASARPTRPARTEHRLRQPRLDRKGVTRRPVHHRSIGERHAVALDRKSAAFVPVGDDRRPPRSDHIR